MIYEKSDFHPDPMFYNNKKFPRKAFLEASGGDYFLLRDEVLKILPNDGFKKSLIGFNNFLANMIAAVNLNKPFLFPFNKNVFKSDKYRGTYHWGYQNMMNIYNAFEQLGFVDRTVGFWDIGNDESKRSTIYPSHSFISSIAPILNSMVVPTVKPIPLSDSKYILPNEQYAFETSISSIPIEVRVGKPKKSINFDTTTKSAISAIKNLNRYNEMIIGHQILVPVQDQPNQSHLSFLDNYNNTFIKRDINYIDNINTTSTYSPIQSQLQHINRNTYLKQVGSELSTIFYNNLEGRLTRKFNSTELTLGGRFYGAQYQFMNKELRPHLLLDGEETVELDYSGFHIRMLYHLNGIDFQDDPYSFVAENDLLRKIYKIAALVIINAKNYPNAIGGLKYELIRKSEKIFGHEITTNDQYNEVIRSLGFNDTAAILNTMREKHEPISKYFFRGKGIKLQNRDSKIAEKVLMHFAKKDIPCLCVHDSFIVAKKYKYELESVMKESYFGLMNYYPKIK